MSGALSRRMFLRSAALGAAAAAIPRRASAQARGRVVVVGGGFGGATCARELRRTGLEVTLIEPDPVYTACPLSNAVLVGMRPIETQQFKLDALEKKGIGIVLQRASYVDPRSRRVVLQRCRMPGRPGSRPRSWPSNFRR